MAYIGLAYPIIARKRDGPEYYDRILTGKAVEAEITPNYIDTSGYTDINDLGQKKEFAYADIKLTTSDLPDTARAIALGESDGVSRDRDESEIIGLGLMRTRIVNDRVTYEAIWLHQAKLWEASGTSGTRGETVDFQTPALEGIAEPDENGEWRTTKQFDTRNEALSWLKEKAGMEGEI